MKIKHLHLHVRDRATSEKFYEEWLGLHVTRRFESLTFMGDGDGFDLALAEDKSLKGMPEWFHFGTRLTSADAVRDLFERMRAAAIPIGKDLYRDDSITSFRCTDPDGYAIEVYWEADASV